VTAADPGDDAEAASHKTIMLNAAAGEPLAPNGTLGFRYSEAGLGRWNLDLGGADPVLTLYRRHTQAVPVDSKCARSELFWSVRYASGVSSPRKADDQVAIRRADVRPHALRNCPIRYLRASPPAR
jgi:nitrate reductase alpha subunit